MANQSIIKPTASFFYLLYFLTVAFFYFLPSSSSSRIWGLNNWSYLLSSFSIILFAIAIIIIVLIYFFRKNEKPRSFLSESLNRQNIFLYFSLSFSVILISAFYLLQSKTYFLGDGYTLLSLLSKESPLIIKNRQLGESLIHVWTYNLMGGGGEPNALRTFQFISYTAGASFLLVLSFFSGRLFENTKEKILFFLGISSGGYMLLYFGYVENYSIFIFSVLTYCLSGLLIAQDKMNRYLILIFQIALIFFHVFGIMFLPATIYLLLRKTKIASRLLSLDKVSKLIITSVIFLSLSMLFWSQYANNYFFRLALVPLITDKLTIENYTLFSFDHIADIVNLLMMLISGLIILIVAFWSLPVRQMWRNDSFKFIAVASSSVLAGAFIFDPKLGMPRDWDLFSFVGLPIAILLYHSLISNRKRLPLVSTIIFLSLSLGFLSLIPRAIVQADEKASVTLFKDYIKLDKIKNRTARAVLINFYNDNNMPKMVQETYNEWKRDFPEENILKSAIEQFANNNYNQSLNLVNQAISLNPVYGDAYSLLGKCLIKFNSSESAIEPLKTAIGLNPSNSDAMNSLGLAYTYLQKNEMAEKYFLKALSIDTLGYSSYYNLFKFYEHTSSDKNSIKFLETASEKKDAPLKLLQELLEIYLKNKQYSQAALFINENLVIKYDSLYMAGLVLTYPEFNSFIMK